MKTMKIKQTKAIILTFIIGLSAVASGIVLPDTAAAANCPAGQEYHSSDNACWTKETRAKTRGTCPSNYNLEGSTCVKYTRENSVPTDDSGAPLSLSCPSGLTYHSSDNKCWREEDTGAAKSCSGTGRGSQSCKPCPTQGTLERDGRCIKYTETSENPTTKGQGDDYYNKYCETSNSDFKDACKAGQENGDCTEFANDGERQACEDGTASRLCGVSDGTGTSNSADARRECYDEVKKCLNEGSAGEQKDCLAKVSGVDEEEVKAIPEVGDDGTGKKCGEAETILIQCEGEGVTAIGNVLRIIITVISILIGVAAVGGLAWASLLYAKATDSEGDTKESKELIRNIVIGLLLYGFMIAIVNWLVPGGIIQ